MKGLTRPTAGNGSPRWKSPCGARSDTVPVAHSLACLQVAHWAAQGPHPRPFLVAPPDPQGPASVAAQAVFPDSLRLFLLVAGSTTDPYADISLTENRARAWKACFVSAGPLGYINADSGRGREWGLGIID